MISASTLLPSGVAGFLISYQSSSNAKKPPYYDPAALSHRRVIVAAFNTGSDLPRGRTRVARLMIQMRGDAKPTYDAKLTGSASADAKAIPARLILSDSATEGAAR